MSERDPSRQLGLEVLERVRNYATEYHGVEVLGLDFDSHSIGMRARLRFRPRGTSEYFNIDYAISLYHSVIRAGTAHAIADDLINELNRFMRDWNNRNAAQQAQRREQQRREAQGREERPPTFTGGMVRPSIGRSTAAPLNIWDDVNDRAARDIQRQEDERFSQEVNRMISSNRLANTEYFSTAASVPQWINVQPSVATTQFVQQVAEQERTYSVTQSDLRRMLAEALQGLDIRISLSESDGDVTAEVEVLFEGEVVASDSDTVAVNSYNYE